MNDERIRSGFVGSLMGTFVGDALGAPLEGRAGWNRLRDGLVREMIEGRRGKGRYTDDTQMMIALAEAIVESEGDPAPEFVVKKFLSNYEPSRGYGWGAHKLMQLWSNGKSWREAAFQIFKDGSLGNGAAMRIAPVGVFYHNVRSALSRYARLSAQVTHAHTLGIQGAVLQAQAVGLALRYRNGGTLSPVNFVLDLLALAREEFPDYRDSLLRVKGFLESSSVEDPKRKLELATNVAKLLGTGFTAPTSVPAAIFSFLVNIESFEEALVFAVNLGGDADTIGAMCGAIAGAYFGIEAIPARWLDVLEDGAKGKTYVISLANRLFELWRRKFSS